MTEIAAKKLVRFGLPANGSQCLVEFEKEDGATGRLDFPSTQLDETIGLLLQVKQLFAERFQASDQRSVLVAERVGVLVQPDAVVMDFMVGGAPISFAIPPEMAVQLMQYLQQQFANPAPATS